MNGKVNKKLLKFSGICALIMLCALVIIGIFELLVLSYENRLEYLEAGERWSSDGERFAVISLYSEEGYSADQVRSWAYSMESALLESSVTPKEGARSWAYSYSSLGSVSVKGPKSTSSAETVAAGGDFFVFHPMKMVYGSYFLNDDSNPMGIVIDRNFAWKLFGAENIVGMTVEINGVEFTVCGVCEQESESGIYGYTYGERPRMFMSYAGYTIAMGGEGSDVTVFETALPNSVKGFGKNIFNSAVRVNEDTSVIIEVTDRFSLKNRYENMKQLKYSWIRSDKIEYPYWENEARVYDFYCAVFMLFEVAMAVVLVVSLLLSLITLRFSGYSLIYDIKKLFSKSGKSRKRPKNPKKKKRQRPDKEII